MATKPELNIAVAYAKNKASEYNENFDKLLNYIEEVSEELELKVNTINSQLSSNVLSNLQAVYPIGSLYVGITDTCPIANLFGTWEKVAEGLCLQGATGSQIPGETVEAGLPNLTGSLPTIVNQSIAYGRGRSTISGVFTGKRLGDTQGSGSGTVNLFNVDVDASQFNPVYGNSETVQPPAYLVNIWKRTA